MWASTQYSSKYVILVFNLDWHSSAIHFQNNILLVLLFIPEIGDIRDLWQSPELCFQYTRHNVGFLSSRIDKLAYSKLYIL